MPNIPPRVKLDIWDEYIKTPKGRQLLACSFIQPLTQMADHLEGNHLSGVLDGAEMLLRNGVRLLGRLALEEEGPPEEFVTALRRLRNRIEGYEPPSAWDRLIADERGLET